MFRQRPGWTPESPTGTFLALPSCSNHFIEKSVSSGDIVLDPCPFNVVVTSSNEASAIHDDAGNHGSPGGQRPTPFGDGHGRYPAVAGAAQRPAAQRPQVRL